VNCGAVGTVQRYTNDRLVLAVEAEMNTVGALPSGPIVTVQLGGGCDALVNSVSSLMVKVRVTFKPGRVNEVLGPSLTNEMDWIKGGIVSASSSVHTALNEG